jgi:hypothetical protein
MKQSMLEKPMKATFARTCSLRLLRLYPRAWRERYADEVAAVLEERPATFMALFDLLLGILDAYVHSDLFTERNFVMLQRLRNSQITIYFSAVFFSIVLLLYRSEDAFFWYPGLANQRGYHLTLVFIDYLSLLLVLTTLKVPTLTMTTEAAPPIPFIVRAGEEWMWGGDPCGRP